MAAKKTQDTDVIIEYELAEDLQAFISQSDDVKFQKAELKNQIFTFDKDVLLEVSKTITSPTTILNVTEVDDEFLQNCV